MVCLGGILNCYDFGFIMNLHFSCFFQNVKQCQSILINHDGLICILMKNKIQQLSLRLRGIGVEAVQDAKLKKTIE